MSDPSYAPQEALMCASCRFPFPPLRVASFEGIESTG